MMYVVPEYQVSRYPFHFRYRDMAFTLENQGIYQVTNARLALTIASKLIHLDSTLTTPAIENASWKGRYETLPYHERSVEIDGAHNVPGIKALIQTLRVKNEKDIKMCIRDSNRGKESLFMQYIIRLLNLSKFLYFNDVFKRTFILPLIDSIGPFDILL